MVENSDEIEPLVAEIKTNIEVLDLKLPEGVTEMQQLQIESLLDDVCFEDDETVLETQSLNCEESLPVLLLFPLVDQSHVYVFHVDLHVVQKTVYHISEIPAILSTVHSACLPLHPSTLHSFPSLFNFDRFLSLRLRLPSTFLLLIELLHSDIQRLDRDLDGFGQYFHNGSMNHQIPIA
jgi:hypothetical protein